jgi:phosphotransferase system HPr (HPr) family protein
MEPAVAVVTINHPLGLHLRSGKEIVLLASQYESVVTARNVTRDSPVVDVKSILQLMQLQARQGHEVHIVAEGPDAEEAVAALRAMLEQLPG